MSRGFHPSCQEPREIAIQSSMGEEGTPGARSLVVSSGSHRHSRHPVVSASLAAGAERASLPVESSSCALRRRPGSARRTPNPQSAACSSGSEPNPGRLEEGWQGRRSSSGQTKNRVGFLGIAALKCTCSPREAKVGRESFCPPGACSPRSAMVQWPRSGRSPDLVHRRDYLGVAASTPPDRSATRGGSGHSVSAQGRRGSCR